MAMRLSTEANEEVYESKCTQISADTLESFRRYLSVLESEGRSGALFSPDPLREINVLESFKKYWFRSTSKGYEKRGAIPVMRLGDYIRRSIKPGEVVAVENIGYALHFLTIGNVVKMIREADELAAEKGAHLAVHVSPNTVDDEELERILGLA